MAPKRVVAGKKRGHREVETDANEATAVVESVPPVPEKKSKLDPTLNGVQKCIEEADLPEACRAMLLALVPASLETVAEERHALQALAVTMLGSFFEERRAVLQQAVRHEEAKLTEIEAGHGGLKATVLAAEEALAERQATVDAKKKVLVTASQEVVAAKAAAAETKEAHRQHEAGILEMEAEKKAVQAALADHFQPLKDGDGEHAQVHIGVILPLARRMKLDGSLISAMPSSCTKKPEERGPFDQMVISQLEELLVAKVAQLSSQLETTNQEATGGGISAAAEAAQLRADGAKELQQQAAGEVFTAQAAHRERAAVLEEAMAGVRSFEPAYREATAVRDRKKADLEAFESWNVKCFETLRDRTAITAAEAPVADEGDTLLAARKHEGLSEQNAVRLAIGGQ